MPLTHHQTKTCRYRYNKRRSFSRLSFIPSSPFLSFSPSPLSHFLAWAALLSAHLRFTRESPHVHVDNVPATAKLLSLCKRRKIWPLFLCEVGLCRSPPLSACITPRSGRALSLFSADPSCRLPVEWPVRPLFLVCSAILDVDAAWEQYFLMHALPCFAHRFLFGYMQSRWVSLSVGRQRGSGTAWDTTTALVVLS